MENIDNLDRYIDKLNRFSYKSENEFQNIIDEGMLLLGLNDETCARLFDVSRPTITRWRNGSTSPVRAMRKLLSDVLKKEATSRLRIYQRRERSKAIA